MEQENTDVSKFERAFEKYMRIIPTLERDQGWITEHLVKYQGFWLTPKAGLKGVMLTQLLFNPQPTDIFLATFPKSGTTWFKALIFAITNRKNIAFGLAKHHPLIDSNPHDCVPFLEAIYSEEDEKMISSKLEQLPSPRILATHLPYTLLGPVLGSPCTTNSPRNKIVYIARNPKDVLISSYGYMNKLRNKSGLPPLPLEEAYDMFCKGVAHFGPYWGHVLDYYRASLAWPEHVLFMTYEDMRAEPSFWVTRLAKFLGQGFTEEEERQGLVDKIIELCSFENLSSLEVNKSGTQKFSSHFWVPNAYFFREGKVGDWRRYLTEEMAEHVDEITKQKFEGTGLRLYG